MKSLEEFTAVIEENNNYRQAGMYKQLSAEQEKEFIKWADENYEPGMDINPVHHPVIVARQIELEIKEDTIFDLRVIRERLDAEAWGDDDMNEDTIVKRIYIGSVFAWYPSGKYYTPWAHSNVTLMEADFDEAWREQAEKELEELGACLEAGEGDPCDLFIAIYKDKEE